MGYIDTRSTSEVKETGYLNTGYTDTWIISIQGLHLKLKKVVTSVLDISIDGLY